MFMKKHLLIIGLTFITLLGIPLLAQAYSLQVQDISRSSSSDLTVDNAWIRASTGEFTVTLKNDLEEPLYSPDGDLDFSAFCIDVDQGIEVGGAAIMVDLVKPSSIQGGLEAAWLMENWQRYTDSGLSQWWSVGLQLALWEVTKDANVNHDYSLGDGNFQFIGASDLNSQNITAGVFTLTNTYLESLANDFNRVGLDELYTAAVNPEYQDLMIRGAIPEAALATPEPGTLLLVVSGLAVLLGLSRRRRRA
jgi:hypothetical protein